jgi:transposase
VDKVTRRFSEEFKQHIVSEVESGNLSLSEAAREYGASKCVVHGWLKDYGKFRPKRTVVEVVMRSEKEKIAELEKALSEAHLKIRLYEKMLEQAGKKYKTDLKKTFGNQPSGAAKGKGGVSK